MADSVSSGGSAPRLYTGLARFLAIPFVLSVGVGAFAITYYAFEAPLFGAVVYGLVSFLLACAFLFSLGLLYQRADLDALLERAPILSPEERQVIFQRSLEDVRRRTAVAQAWKNRRVFYQNALIIALALVGIAAMGRHFFGLYPREVFIVPFPALVAMSALAALFLPRVLLIVLLLAGVAVAMMALGLGPEFVLFLLPYLLTFPLLMVINFLILFGPLAIFNLMQIKIIRPGEATWGVSMDDVRGQEEAKKQILTALRIFASAEGQRLVELGGRPERGILMVGPPGTGKTLIAKAIASTLSAPIIITNGSAFLSTFLAIDVLVMLYMRLRAEGLAREFGRVVVFIDEAEMLLQRRGGMQPVQTQGGASRVDSIWSIFDYDHNGCISSCGLMFDHSSAREAFWERKFPPRQQTSPQMVPFPFFGGAGGFSLAIFPFLVWLDGMDSPPLLSRLVRSKVNELLDVLFVPPYIRLGGATIYLRLPPARPPAHNIYFFAATNRPHLIDPAMRRPGRFGKTVVFATPGEAEREDIAALYFSKVAHHPSLDEPDRRKEFARVTVGLSPAEIEQVIRDAVNYRHDHIQRLKEIKAAVEAGRPLDRDSQKFWERYRHELDQPDWDKPWVTWDALMESLAAVRHGTAKPTRTTERNRERTAYHEFAGHFLPLRYFCGEWYRPIVLSIMPRGEALGMVAHVPIEEHDPQPQHVLEGLLRVSVGSIVAERLFFQDNEPGVSKDLENATRIAAAMVGLFGMVPRRCTPDERRRYQRIGESILSVANSHPMLPTESNGFVASTLGSPRKREDVCVLLGQAFVDVYRLLRKNRDLAPPVVRELLEKDELVGRDLERLWDTLELQPLHPDDKAIWPEEEVAPENPFYRNSDGARAQAAGSA
ncbi:ATP-dependent zinc metalloprotease FtsH [bacterium HR24]|nr:ATP-dependent zinc metalloprotease FtsH [bacterium HR24]